MNDKRSYTEYTVTTATTDFVIGFDDYDESTKDSIVVTVDGILAESQGFAVMRKNAQVVTITPAVQNAVVRLERVTDIDKSFHQFTAGALFSAKSVDENFEQVRHSQQEVRDGFTFLEFNTNGIVQASKEATLEAKAATATATASAVRAESAAGTAVQAVGAVQGVVNAATAATASANTASTQAAQAASTAATATTAAQSAIQAATAAQGAANTAANAANAATTNSNAATGRANAAAERVDDLVIGKVRAQDVSTSDGSTQAVKNTEFRDELDAIPFVNGKLSGTRVTTAPDFIGAVVRTQQDKNNDVTSLLDFYNPTKQGATHNTAFKLAISYLDAQGGGTLHIPDGKFYLDPDEETILLKDNIEIRGSQNSIIQLTEFSRSNQWGVFTLSDTENVRIRNLKLRGSRELKKPNVLGVPSGTYYKDFRTNPVVSVGEYVYGHGAGFVVTQAGTCASYEYSENHIPFVQAHSSENLSTTPVYLNTGTAKLRYVERSLGEWIMGVSLYSAKNTIIENLDIEGFWGDGLFVGREGTAYWGSPYAAYSENLVVRDVKISNCRRQGISVVSLKNGRFNNIDISNIFGTAPEGFIDFEPDVVDELLEDIIVTGLRTDGVNSTGVLIELAAFTSGYAGFNRADYNEEGYSQTKPIEQINYYIANAVAASKNSNKISITIDDWIGTSGCGLILNGCRHETENGYVKLINSSVTYSHPRLDFGCVFLRGTLKDAPTIFIKDSTLINNTTGALPHITLDKPSRIKPLMGGIHLENVTTVCKKTISLDFPVRTDIVLTDSSSYTDRFDDISIINCKAIPNNIGQVPAMLGTTYTVKRATGLKLVDEKEVFSLVMPDNATNIYGLDDLYTLLSYYRPDSVSPTYEMSINNFPIGEGAILKISNELCAVGSGKTLEVSTPFYSKFTNLSKNSNTATSSAGGKQRLIIPAGSYITVRTIDINNGYIEHMDAATYKATLHYGGTLTVLPADPVVVEAGATVKRTILMPNLFDDSAVMANLNNVNLGGLTLTTKVENKAYVAFNFTNNTSASVSWSGTIKTVVL